MTDDYTVLEVTGEKTSTEATQFTVRHRTRSARSSRLQFVHIVKYRINRMHAVWTEYVQVTLVEDGYRIGCELEINTVNSRGVSPCRLRHVVHVETPTHCHEACPDFI